MRDWVLYIVFGFIFLSILLGLSTLLFSRCCKTPKIIEHLNFANDEYDTINMYYINMEKSKDRNEKILKDVKNCSNIYPNRINALTPDIVKTLKINRDSTCTVMNEKELACTLSHLKAIYTAYQNNDDAALISEDDIICLKEPDLRKILTTNVPKDWEILQLIAFNKRASNFYIENNGKNTWIPHEYKDTSAAVYLINRKGMEKILNRIFDGDIKTPYEKNSFNLTNFTVKDKDTCAADYLIYSLCKTYIYSDLYFNIT